MKNNFKKVKIGQKVWSSTFGKGTVVLIDDNSKPNFDVSHNNQLFSFVVQFGIEQNVFNHDYDVWGVRIETGALFPELHLKKPVITTKKRLSQLNAESFGKGISEGEHLERLFSENINIAEVVERALSIASDHVMESEGSDFGLYMLKHQIADTIKGEFLNVHTMKPPKK